MNSEALPAEVLLKETTAQLAACVKGSPQHDDLTVIVVAVAKNASGEQEVPPEPENEKRGEAQT